MERYALFMKVYTHRVKTSASAMLGKALQLVLGTKRGQLNENSIERMGDEELLTAIHSTRSQQASRIIAALQNRRLFKPVFRAQALEENQRTISGYEAKQVQWREAGLFDPQIRINKEEEIAKKAKVDPSDVVLYCTHNAPGAQKVRYYVDVASDGSRKLVADSDQFNQSMLRAHLALWRVYAFCNPELADEKKEQIASSAQYIFGCVNEIKNIASRPALPLFGGGARR